MCTKYFIDKYHKPYTEKVRVGVGIMREEKGKR